jgi:hypothetical protein
MALPTPDRRVRISVMADIAMFSSKPYDRRGFGGVNSALDAPLTIEYLEARLTEQTAPLAVGVSARGIG